MNIPFTIILFGLVAASAEILGGSVVLMQKEWPQKIQEYLLALGAGFILALVLLDLIPASITGIGSTAPLLILTGFSVMHFAEHTVVGHLHFGEEVHSEVMVSKVASYSAFWGLFIHAFFDGVSISAGMQVQFFAGTDDIFCDIAAQVSGRIDDCFRYARCRPSAEKCILGVCQRGGRYNARYCRDVSFGRYQQTGCRLCLRIFSRSRNVRRSERPYS